MDQNAFQSIPETPACATSGTPRAEQALPGQTTQFVRANLGPDLGMWK